MRIRNRIQAKERKKNKILTQISIGKRKAKWKTKREQL